MFLSLFLFSLIFITSICSARNIDLKQHLNGTNCSAALSFYCGSGECISLAKYRDGIDDCQDGSDEECLLNQTRCDGNKCMANPSDCKDFILHNCHLPGYVRCPMTTHCFEGTEADLLLFCTNVTQENPTMNDTKVIEEQFKTFKHRHGKSYSKQEEKKRRAIFSDNYARVEQHNNRFKAKKVTFDVSINTDSDKTLSEIIAVRNRASKPFVNLKSPVLAAAAGKNLSANSDLAPNAPVLWDWRNFNKNRIIDSKTILTAPVSPVKDQGNLCGSCWAFSTAESLSGAAFACNGSIHDYSAQALIDCTRSYGNQGCQGGWPSSAMEFVKDSRLTIEDYQYPYKNGNNTRSYSCQLSSQNGDSIQAGVVMLPSGDENAMRNALVNFGPLTVAIYASVWEFMYYKSGVFQTSSCRGQQSNHAMLLIGYGTDAVGGDYWLVKNTWGTVWGENGYVKIARNRGNMCNIASDAAYPDFTYNTGCTWPYRPKF